MNVKLKLTDFEPDAASFLSAVFDGLSREQKQLPTPYLYDARGSALFDKICDLPEYYPTRTERAIMRQHADDIAARIGPRVTLIEYGSGSSIKTRDLLETLEDPVAYVPVDISRAHLGRSAKNLSDRFPHLEVLPVCADFTAPFSVPQPRREPRRRVLYFPGSTIGNFRPGQAVRLLKHMRNEVGLGGGVLIGVDLVKSPVVLEQAYNDSQGVTADFNLNLLVRINHELGADFDLSAFRHEAVWVAQRSAIEMRLVSRRRQCVAIGNRSFTFAEDEWIHTEDSHKYTLDAFAELAEQADLQVEQVWTDAEQKFSVQFLA